LDRKNAPAANAFDANGVSNASGFEKSGDVGH
jgi:hypothetical protein